MGLDILTIPPSGQTLRYVKASYDFARDGGEVGVHAIPSQQVPAGAILFGPSVATIDVPTSDAAPGILFHVGTATSASYDFGSFAGPTGRLDLVWGPTQSDGSYPVTLEITGDPLTGGAFLIYVWYVV